MYRAGMCRMWICGVAAGLVCVAQLAALGQDKGIFSEQTDVGRVKQAGLGFDAASGEYRIRSSGANLWGAQDDFHFVWKKMSGDAALTADISFPESKSGASPHRKAMLMFRESLDPDAVYADVALHGNGETALQYRQRKGDTTQDIAFNSGAPKTLRLEKRGNVFTLFISQAGEPLHQAGASVKVSLPETFYVGIGMCAHDENGVETGKFDHVELKALEKAGAPPQTSVYSTLKTIAIDPDARAALVVVTAKGRMEAPNWSRDGKTLVFTRDGKLWTVAATGGEPEAIDLGGAKDCTGSHGLSPDGKWLAATCVGPDQPGRRVFIVPVGGGKPRMVTANPDSYFHSWSPDGKTIAFTRPSKGSGNIYAISVEGGAETALTTGSGISDDPDYSPDGKWIYFNSDRSGAMEIWRMKPDGSAPEQVTKDGMANWTPHPSPDGKSVLILSFGKGVTGHPADKDIKLRILDAGSGEMRDLVEIVGGSGTDNVPNWSPDGKHFAFVSYQRLPEDRNGATE